MARFRVTYRDGTPPQEISVGAYAQIAAKRRYGQQAIADGDPEPGIFGMFVEIVGPAKAADPVAFDEWLLRVEEAEHLNGAQADDEDPPAAEASSASLPDSPPTSESTPPES